MLDFRFPWLLVILPLLLWAMRRVPYRWGIPRERPTGFLPKLFARTLPPLVATLLVLAAVGPEWRVNVKGITPVVDFAVVLDGSSSMLAMDGGKESRWDAARRILRRFIARRPDDRFALVIFSAYPVTLAPLTSDHPRLWVMLERLEIATREDGTAIGSGLMTAVRRLANSPARSRVILLLTDGAQNRGRVTPVEAAQEAKASGIRIHTVAIGGTEEALMPIDGGGLAPIRVPIDHDSLEQVAAATGGEAFTANDPEGLERSLAAIDTLEKTAVPVGAPSEGRPLARWMLLAATLFALPLTLDSWRKRGAKAPRWLLEPGGRT